MSNPFFSIVMPTYNVDKYIEKAIKSIQAQSFEDWEIIIVDDCTPDKSAQIALEMSRSDKRIRVVHHEVNQGLSPARNTGMDAATGRYIWFMDPDDYVEADILERVKASVDKNPAEVVMFGLVEEYYDRDGNLEYSHEICPTGKLFDKQDELRKEVIKLEQETLYGYAWNKIYNLDYLRGIQLRYENVKLIEDILFNVKYFRDIEKLNILGCSPYHYAKRLSANLTNKFVEEYFELHRRRIEIIFEQHLYWGKCDANVRRILGSLYGRYILSALERNCDGRSGMSHKQRRQWCKELFNEKLFNELIPEAQADGSKALMITLALLKCKSVSLCLLMGRGVHLIRRGCPMIYSKVKSGR